MGTTAKVNFRAGGTGASGTDWNNTGLRGTPGFPLALDDTSNVSTGWSIDFAVADPDSSRQGELGVNAVGSGDAAWVNEAEVSDDYWWGSTETLELKFTGLDNAKTYTVRVFGSRENTTGTRTTKLTIGASNDTHNCLGNSSLISEVTGVSPSTGEIAFDISTDDDNWYLNAAYIEEEAATGPGPGTISISITG